MGQTAAAFCEGCCCCSDELTNHQRLEDDPDVCEDGFQRVVNKMTRINSSERTLEGLPPPSYDQTQNFRMTQVNNPMSPDSNEELLPMPTFPTIKKHKNVHWVQYTTEDGVPYYVDTDTGLTKWERPRSPIVVGNKLPESNKTTLEDEVTAKTGDEDEDQEDTHDDIKERMKATEWIRYVDDNTKAEYFRNLKTGKTTWSRPVLFAVDADDAEDYSSRRHSLESNHGNEAGLKQLVGQMGGGDDERLLNVEDARGIDSNGKNNATLQPSSHDDADMISGNANIFQSFGPATASSSFFQEGSLQNSSPSNDHKSFDKQPKTNLERNPQDTSDPSAEDGRRKDDARNNAAEDDEASGGKDAVEATCRPIHTDGSKAKERKEPAGVVSKDGFALCSNDEDDDDGDESEHERQ
eukprot:jgi/Bigna1/144817/aug1.91_g19525